MTIDVFSHPWLGGLFADEEIAALLEADSMLTNMVAVEAAYARALGQAGCVDLALATKAAAAIEICNISMKKLREGTAQDGVVVPALVRALKTRVPPELHTAVHDGMTSQDVIDTSLVMSLKSACQVLDIRLKALGEELDRLAAEFGTNALMGRSRMQAALEIKVADRIRAWRSPLTTHRNRLVELSPRIFNCQLGSAAGDRAFWGDKAADIERAMAEELDLGAPGESWHSQRGGIAEFANWLSMVTGTLGKMGQDVALMAQQGIDEIKLAGGGGSSAMPHKQNPILAELLVTLSQFNATQVTGIHLAMVHEQERSGAAWSLEWMILPQMLMATGTSLLKAPEICRSIDGMGHSAAS